MKPRGRRLHIEAWILGGLMLGATVEMLIGAVEQVRAWL